MSVEKHGGRIQAQGENTEQSESWAFEKPPTKKQGEEMLDNLKKKLSKKELKIRESAFKKALRFIRNGPYKVVDRIISKTFMVPDTEHERVDIEIQKGTAFTSENEQ